MNTPRQFPISSVQPSGENQITTGARAQISTDELVRCYLDAKRSVIDSGYTHEIFWQFSTGPLTPKLFLREATWVILCTGMSEAVVRRVYPALLDRLSGLNPDWLVSHATTARQRALRIFGNERKIDSILQIANVVHAIGIDGLHRRMRDPESFLLSLPYIGPITWRHLAKNLGAPVAKADRHLVRLAEAAGRSSVDDLCAEISAWMGDPVPVVDIVLWRWSVLHGRSCNGACPGLPHDRIHSLTSLSGDSDFPRGAGNTVTGESFKL